MPEPPMGVREPSRMAARMRCERNHAALYVICRMRCSWCEEMPFFRATEQVDRLKHLMQRDTAVLENGAYF